jgi:hypothetical protein
MKKMPKTKILDEKRHVFLCDVCGGETLATRKLEVIAHMNRIYHISEWRVCPVREGERGCGHWQLFNYEISEEEFISRQKAEQDQNVPVNQVEKEQK